MNMKLRILWIAPHVFLYLVNLGFLLFIVLNWTDLKQYGNPGLFVFIWVVFTLVQLFGSYKIFEWLKNGHL